MSAYTYSSLPMLLKQRLDIFRLFLTIAAATTAVPRRGLHARCLWGCTWGLLRRGLGQTTTGFLQHRWGGILEHPFACRHSVTMGLIFKWFITRQFFSVCKAIRRWFKYRACLTAAVLLLRDGLYVSVRNLKKKELYMKLECGVIFYLNP